MDLLPEHPLMSWLQVLLIAIGLSMDAFAVALGTGTSRSSPNPRAVFRIAFHFGLFQTLMPILGWSVAAAMSNAIASFDHWVAFGLLWFIGIRMLMAAFGEKGEDEERNDPSKGLSLVALSVATSIDALAVGISLGLLGERIWWPSLVIGCVTGVLSMTGMFLGKRLGMRFGSGMEILGGLILLGIGVQILIVHLSS